MVQTHGLLLRRVGDSTDEAVWLLLLLLGIIILHSRGSSTDVDLAMTAVIAGMVTDAAVAMTVATAAAAAMSAVVLL